MSGIFRVIHTRMGRAALAAVTLLLLGGLVVAACTAQSQKKTAAASTYQTSPVRRGDLSVSVSGTANLSAQTVADLAFSTTGTLAVLNVQPGDRVKAGQVLAQLADPTELKVQLVTRQLAVKSAEKALTALTDGKDAALAQALLDRVQAQADLETAKTDLHENGDGRCDPAKTQEYFFVYFDLQKEVSKWQNYLDEGNSPYGTDYILATLNPLKIKLRQAYANYTYCQGYTAQEVAASKANLQAAEARQQETEAAYQQLLSNGGLDPDATALAETRLKAARLELAQTEKALTGVTLTAPIDGTVMSVAGAVGDEVGTGVFITLADLDHPTAVVTIDESDLPNVAVGCNTEVTLNAISSRTFRGTVASIAPSITNTMFVTGLQVTVNLPDATLMPGRSLPDGLSGSAEVTCSQADSVLMVPSEAVHTAADGSSYVYMLNSSGQPEQRAVEVGLMTTAFAEIKSGLSLGETVITSAVK